jgi:hypothetical protein
MRFSFSGARAVASLTLLFAALAIAPGHAAEPAPAAAPKKPELVFSSDAKGNIFTATEGRVRLALPKEGVTGGSVTLRDELGKVIATQPVPASASGSAE